MVAADYKAEREKRGKPASGSGTNDHEHPIRKNQSAENGV
jgi:hypothetical protein